MRSVLRKLKGALGTAVTWAVAWAVGGFTLITLAFVFNGGGPLYWDTMRPVTVLSGISGFIAGAVFSLVLATVHRRRQLGELRPWRMALWGAAAGVLLPLGLMGLAVSRGASIPPDLAGVIVLALGGLGAGTAAGTVKLAQAAGPPLERPPPRDRLASGG